MTPGPEQALAQSLVDRLEALREVVTRAEDDVLACLVVTGEPRPQRVLDDWLDQSADTLRAIGESASDLGPRLTRWTGPPGAQTSDAPAVAAQTSDAPTVAAKTTDPLTPDAPTTDAQRAAQR